jgi:hypothetical protein
MKVGFWLNVNKGACCEQVAVLTTGGADYDIDKQPVQASASSYHHGLYKVLEKFCT